MIHMWMKHDLLCVWVHDHDGNSALVTGWVSERDGMLAGQTVEVWWS